MHVNFAIFRQDAINFFIRQRFQRIGATFTRAGAFEITETVIERINEHFYLNIEQLRKQGVRISIDDFGTGLSNLKRFYEINPDSIKVDSQFTGDIFGTAGKIVRIIFDLARYNRIPVIAEGVESEDVARELIKLGCVQAQGYLYQKPMPFSAWDKSGKLVKE